LGDPTEFGGVGLAGPVECPLLELMKIPEEIGADGVESHGLAELEPVTPVFPGDACEVDFSAPDLKRLFVEEEVGFPDQKGVGRRRGWYGQCHGNQGDEEGKGCAHR